MVSFGLDLAKSPAQALGDGSRHRLIYVLLVVALGVLYFLQQRMVAARAAVSPTMSPTQQKLMQYLPVAFAVFQVFFLAGLVIYYMAQAILRIGQQAYITRRFYGHDEALGRQAQRAGEQARELAKQRTAVAADCSPRPSASWPLAQGRRRRRRHAATAEADASAGERRTRTGGAEAARPTPKRTTPPKDRPTPPVGGAVGRSARRQPLEEQRQAPR